MQITAGGTTLDAIPVVVWVNQVSAILPSSAPVGAATVTLTYNGQTSAPYAIQVVANAFGMFGINQAGSGPGVFTDPNWAVNTLFNSAAPGSYWIISGTGLGAVQGNEADDALPGDMTNLDVQVLVGGQQAQVTYRGRSGCCAGLDQIVFIIPAGV